MAMAHGGGPNAQGCHNDRKRGGYHCHRSPSIRATSRRPVRLSTPQAYPNCDEARDAGKAPIYRGRQGYGPHLDRNGDGIRCEGSASSGGGYRTPIQAAGQVARVALPSASASGVSAMPVPIEGRSQVPDGDTIQIGITPIRLFGIDAFEAEQMCVAADGSKYGCGGKATRALLERIDSEPVACSTKGDDAFGRQLAVCRAAATDLRAWIVRHGHALAYSKYAFDNVADERHAKAGSAGAWSICLGSTGSRATVAPLKRSARRLHRPPIA
jgi:endonuclease YncB( thermonuclease family)